MDFELGSRTKKLQVEQEKRRSEARKRVEQERRAQQIASAHSALVQEQLRQKRIEQALHEEYVRKLAEENLRRTEGIQYSELLNVIAYTSDNDKIILPPSALESLTQQDALSKGPMLFELTLIEIPGLNLVEGRKTHGGVLEFIADEGTVRLPIKVLRSLGLNEEQSQLEGMKVQVRYVRLPKAKLAKIIPLSTGLSQITDLRVMLENNLQMHATLTEGDWLEVWYRGKRFELKVDRTEPESAVTIINADVEIDLDLPPDARAAIEKQTLGDRAKTLRNHMESSKSISPILEARKRISSSSSNDSDLEIEEFNSETHREKMRNSLPLEPLSDSNLKTVTFQIRWQGGRFTRRFYSSDHLKYLFDFCESETGLRPGSYRIVSSFPRRVFLREEIGDISFETGGLGARQEAVTIETIL